MQTADQLTEELRAVLKEGLTVRSIAAVPSLLSLSIAHAKAASSESVDLAPTALGLVAEAAARVDETTNGATATLLGVASGSRGLTLTDRRAEAAGLLHVNPDHFRKHMERERVQALADELLAMDSVFQARLRHKLAQPTPINSRLEVDWLARHQAYRRIWTPVSAMRGDILVLLGFLRNDAEHFEVTDRVMNILWRRAQFTKAIEDFIQQYGGLWLLSDPNKESQAAAAVRQISVKRPGGENDDSWLRLRLAEAVEGELDSFGDLVWQSEQGKEMVQLWLEWARVCRCPLDTDAAPRSTCEVHTWLTACDDFIYLIDEDFDEISDFYRQTRSSAHLNNALAVDPAVADGRTPT